MKCGVEFGYSRAKPIRPSVPRKYCKNCLHGLLGDASRRYHGERYITSDGYARVMANGEYIFEHRLVMGEILGRPLIKGEAVHHINGVKNDNRPENLELWVQPRQHLSGQRAKDILCPHCGRTYWDG